MSILSELTRLQTAKANIKAAIEGKGVTVPSNARISDFASLISSIQTGGGSGGGGYMSGTIPSGSIATYDNIVIPNVPSNPRAGLLFHNGGIDDIFDPGTCRGYAFYMRFTDDLIGSGVLSVCPPYSLMDPTLYPWEYSPAAQTLTIYLQSAWAFWGMWETGSPVVYAISL